MIVFFFSCFLDIFGIFFVSWTWSGGDFFHQTKAMRTKIATGWIFFFFRRIGLILLMEEILHQLIGRLSHCLQGFIHPRWCRISSINSSLAPSELPSIRQGSLNCLVLRGIKMIKKSMVIFSRICPRNQGMRCPIVGSFQKIKVIVHLSGS